MTNKQPSGSQPELFTLHICAPKDDGQRFLSEATSAEITSYFRKHYKCKMGRIWLKLCNGYPAPGLAMKGLIAYRLNGDGTTGFPLPGTFHGDN